MNNGLVDLLTPPASGSTQFKNANPGVEYDNIRFNREAVQGVLTPTPLSDLYFSQANVEALHQGIRYKVFMQTQKVIDKQSDAELRIIMRAVFFSEALHLPTNLVPQVQALNESVLKQTVPNIISNLKQYEQYRVDQSRLRTPLAKPENIRSHKILDLGPRF